MVVMCPWRRRELIAGVAAKVVRWLVVEAIVVVALVVLWLRRAMLVVVMVVEMWLVQNNDRRRKTYLKGSQPG